MLSSRQSQILQRARYLNPRIHIPAFDSDIAELEEEKRKELLRMLSSCKSARDVDLDRVREIIGEAHAADHDDRYDVDRVADLVTKAFAAGKDSVAKAKDRRARDSERDEDERKPRTHAEDRTLEARFPEVARIKGYTPPLKQKRPAPMSASAAADFAESFPDAARIRGAI